MRTRMALLCIIESARGAVLVGGFPVMEIYIPRVTPKIALFSPEDGCDCDCGSDMTAWDQCRFCVLGYDVQGNQRRSRSWKCSRNFASASQAALYSSSIRLCYLGPSLWCVLPVHRWCGLPVRRWCVLPGYQCIDGACYQCVRSPVSVHRSNEYEIPPPANMELLSESSVFAINTFRSF